MPFSYLADELKRREADGLLRRRRILESPQGARVRVDGADVLSFCSNDYLGLADHPALIQAACGGARQFGVGAGASHLVTGHTAAHHELEQALAGFTGLYFTVYVVTDDTYRREFRDDVIAELREALAVRAAYRHLIS